MGGRDREVKGGIMDEKGTRGKEDKSEEGKGRRQGE